MKKISVHVVFQLVSNAFCTTLPKIFGICYLKSCLNVLCFGTIVLLKMSLGYRNNSEQSKMGV